MLMYSKFHHQSYGGRASAMLLFWAGVAQRKWLVVYTGKLLEYLPTLSQKHGHQSQLLRRELGTRI